MTRSAPSRDANQRNLVALHKARRERPRAQRAEIYLPRPFPAAKEVVTAAGNLQEQIAVSGNTPLRVMFSVAFYLADR